MLITKPTDLRDREPLESRPTTEWEARVQLAACYRLGRALRDGRHHLRPHHGAHSPARAIPS